MTAPQSFHEEDALGKAYDGRLMRRLLRYARPYGALVATFHTCLGCLMGPSVLFFATKALVG